jgi:hypothetical protein
MPIRHLVDTESANPITKLSLSDEPHFWFTHHAIEENFAKGCDSGREVDLPLAR